MSKKGKKAEAPKVEAPKVEAIKHVMGAKAMPFQGRMIAPGQEVTKAKLGEELFNSLLKAKRIVKG